MAAETSARFCCECGEPYDESHTHDPHSVYSAHDTRNMRSESAETSLHSVDSGMHGGMHGGDGGMHGGDSGMVVCMVALSMQIQLDLRSDAYESNAKHDRPMHRMMMSLRQPSPVPSPVPRARGVEALRA